MSEENDLTVYQVVIQDCSYEIYDEEKSYEVKRFNIDKVGFDDKKELQEFVNDEHMFSPGDRTVMDEIQFIDGEQADDPDGDYEQEGGDWDELKTFKTYDEAESYRQKLICSYEASENKYEWIPEDVKL